MAGKYDIEKFNGRNFSLWKMRIKALLRKDNCLEAITGRPAAITDDAKWKQMDGDAVANIHLTLADEILSSVEEKNSAKEIWDHLVKLYQAKSLHSKIFLKRKLYSLRMEESSSVTEHINKLNTLFSQLKALDHIIESNERAELLLQSLPDSYDQLVISLTNNSLTGELNFDDIAAAVLEEESRRNNKDDKSGGSQQAEALAVTRGRSDVHGSSGSHHHGRKSKSKKVLKCYYCGKKNHMKKDCWKLKNSNPQGNVASTLEDGNAMVCEAATTIGRRERFTDVWLLDSAATFHMTSRKECSSTMNLPLEEMFIAVMIKL